VIRFCLGLDLFLRTGINDDRLMLSNLFLASSGVPQGSHLSSILFSLFINNLHHVLHHCHFLCFADDIKIYLRVCTPNDCTKIQSDLNRFSDWCNTLGLTINYSKCKIMTFTRSRSPLKSQYFLNGNAISRAIECVMDLGFRLSYNLDPSVHIEYVCCKAFKTLFCALVRPILEYGAIVWDPHTADNSRQLESVQRRFLRFAIFILKIPCTPHNYTPAATILGLSSLAERRRVAGINFLAGLLNNNIDSPVLLSLINIKIPFRSTVPFFVPHASTNYMANEPLRHLMSIANEDPTFSDKLII